MSDTHVNESEPVIKSEPNGSEGSLFNESSAEQLAKGTTLLSSITYSTREDYDNFLNNLTTEHSIIVLISAANHCQARGIFTLEEAELLSKSIKCLASQAKQQPHT